MSTTGRPASIFRDSAQGDSFRNLGALSILAVGILVCSGCEDDDPTKGGVQSHPFAAETVTIAVPKGRGFAEVWKGLLDEWSVQTGAAYRLVEYDAAAARQELPTGDLIILPFISLGQYAAQERLGAMPNALIVGEAATGWLDFFAGLRERVLSVGGTPTLIPLSCPVLTCYLRRDLLDKAGLKPPRTWEEYQTLLETSSKWAGGLPVVEPWGPDFRATMFDARALPFVKYPASFSVFFDIDTGDPLIDSPGFVRALEQSLAAVTKMPPDVKSFTPADCRRLVLTGKAAMAISFEPGQSGGKPLERPAGVALTFVQMPGTREFYSRNSKAWETPPEQSINNATLAPFEGLAAAVSRSLPPKRSEAAWNLASFLGLDRYEQAFADVPKSVCRESQLSGSATWVSSDLRPQELFSYWGATAESLRQSNLSADLPVVGRFRFREALRDGLTAALEKKASPQDALRSVADRWRAISKELGVEKVRDSYRKCLGLPAAMKQPDLR